MKIYVCVDGEYSDSSVAAVFTDPDKAKLASERMGWELTEMETDTVNPSEWPSGSPYRLYVRIMPDQERVERHVSSLSAPWPATPWESEGPDFVRVVWAEDRDAAYRLTEDKAAEVRLELATRQAEYRRGVRP